jgi:hypothetical protein
MLDENKITPEVISIVDTGLGQRSVTEEYGSGLTKDRILASRIDQLL